VPGSLKSEYPSGSRG